MNDEHGPLELVSDETVAYELKAMAACVVDVVPLSRQLSCGASRMAIVEKEAWALEEPGSTPKAHPKLSIPCGPSQFGLLRMQKTEKENTVLLFFRASKKKFEQNGLSQNGLSQNGEFDFCTTRGTLRIKRIFW